MKTKLLRVTVVKTVVRTTGLVAQALIAVFVSLSVYYLITYVLGGSGVWSIPVICAVLVLILFGLRWRPRALPTYALVATLTTCLTVALVLLAVLYTTTRPPVVYVVLDATEHSASQFESLSKQVAVTAIQVLPDRTVMGISRYGGSVAGSSPETGTVRVMELTQVRKAKDAISATLARISPSGSGSLLGAVHDAVEAVKSVRGPVKLIAIAAGVDSDYDPVVGPVSTNMAADIKERRAYIQLEILGVAIDDPVAVHALESYALALGGHFTNVSTPGGVPTIIAAPIGYFTSYSEFSGGGN